MSLRDDEYCHCARGDVADHYCHGKKCGPQYPWARPKKNGAAVLDTIVALQRSELARELPSHASPCASGTWHTTGQKILKAVNQQNATRLTARLVPTEWRSLEKWREEQQAKYDALIAEKRAAAQAEPAS